MVYLAKYQHTQQSPCLKVTTVWSKYSETEKSTAAA